MFDIEENEKYYLTEVIYFLGKLSQIHTILEKGIPYDSDDEYNLRRRRVQLRVLKFLPIIDEIKYVENINDCPIWEINQI